MEKRTHFDQMVTLTVEVPVEVAKGIEAMAAMRKLSEGSLLRLWMEEALERDELRFERLLLFADVTSGLDEQALRSLASIRKRYFDEQFDGERGLDAYVVKSTNCNRLYRSGSGTIPYPTMK